MEQNKLFIDSGQFRADHFDLLLGFCASHKVIAQKHKHLFEMVYIGLVMFGNGCSVTQID